MDPIRFARQLRAPRIRRELRQEDVARIAGVSRSVVSRLELGRIQPTSVRTLHRAAAALGATIDVRLRWNPRDPISGLLFVAFGPRGSVRRTGPARERVRVRGRQRRAARLGANDHRTGG